jgi:penicillin-binding protein 1A
LNVPTIRLLEKIGIDETIQYARKLGVRSPLGRYLSLALGSSDVTLAELTSAYAVFANHGIKLGPVSIRTITDSTGRVLYLNDVVPEQVLKPENAYLITYLLRGWLNANWMEKSANWADPGRQDRHHRRLP